MKCPKCSNNHRRSAGMTCTCGYAFALDPKVDGIGDRRFVAFINGASCNATYAFTENQLYTAACRKQLTQPIGVLILLVLVAIAVAAYMFVNNFWHVVPLGLLAGSCIGVFAWLYCHYIRPLSRRKFDGWLEKYVGGQGPIEGLVEAGKLTDPPPQNRRARHLRLRRRTRINRPTTAAG